MNRFEDDRYDRDGQRRWREEGRSRGGERERGGRGGLGTPPINSVHNGKIKQVLNFGAFVSIEGYQRDGLIHISQIKRDEHVKEIHEVLTEGQPVWAKVTRVQDDGKFGLDMRYINQQTGEDSDPTNSLVQQGWGNRGRNDDRYGGHNSSRGY